MVAFQQNGFSEGIVELIGLIESNIPKYSALLSEEKNKWSWEITEDIWKNTGRVLRIFIEDIPWGIDRKMCSEK